VQHLLERILATEIMELEWKRMKTNKGKPGVDGITIEQFSDHKRKFLAKIYFSMTIKAVGRHA
jgi:RNA-directed DNA polymerase